MIKIGTRWPTDDWRKAFYLMLLHSMYIQNRNYKAAIQDVFTTPLQMCQMQSLFASYWPKGNSSCRQLTNRWKGAQRGSRGCRGRRPPENRSSALPSHSLTPCLPLPAAPVFQCGFWPFIPEPWCQANMRLSPSSSVHTEMFCTPGIAQVWLGPLAM